MKKKKFLLLTLIFVLLFSTNVWGASYYSYNNLGLNYGKSSGSFYGAGKNGYKWVNITSVKGSKIKYRYAKFSYSKEIGHHIIKPYGKTYTATLTSSTKYYKSAPWSRLSNMRACGDGGVATKEEYVEILEFTHFVEFFSFKKIGENHKEKSLVKKVTVVVALDLGTGNTKNLEYENE